MEKQKLTIERIIKISQAIDLLDTNTTIDPTISYRLGRLHDSCTSIKKQLDKSQQKLVNEFNKKRSNLIGEVEDKDISQSVKDEITDLANKLQEDLGNLNDQEDEIFKYQFNLSDFKAKEDIKLENNTIKKDQSLVPTKFFKLMGDLINE